VIRTADTFESRVRKQLGDVDKTIDELRSIENLEIFPMNERQLERSLEIGFLEIPGLEAFDHAGKLITSQPWLGSTCKRR
jgi:hypothetical protein